MNNNQLLKHIRPEIPLPFNEINLLRKHWPRLVGVFKGLVLPPYEIIIHPSSNCNLRCEWCIGTKVKHQESSNIETSLPNNLQHPENILRLIEGIVRYKKEVQIDTGKGEELHVFKVENITFSGIEGEPLMSKKSVLSAINRLKCEDVRIGMFTNGILMTEDTWASLLKVNYVLVSLDAGSGATYSRLKFGNSKLGESSFYTVVKNIEGLNKAKEESKTSNLEINVSFIVYPENYNEIYDAAVLSKSLGARYFRIKQDISKRKMLNKEQIEIVNYQLGKVEKNLNDISFQLVRLHNVDNVKEMNRNFPDCIISDLMAAVGSDGNLYPCNYHPDVSRPNYGNVYENPFSEVWESTERARLSKKLPCICPAVCDPFKNRSNGLLYSAKNIWSTNGLHYLNTCREEFIANYK
jgi:MoaA/NifB/PqqE/SkfB family radical SAM enzyme